MLSQYKNILIVGLGASSLNLRALLSAARSHTTSFHFLDTLDPYIVSEMERKIDKNTAIIFISKSGNTHETNLLLEHMKSHENIFIMSSGNSSNMYKIAQNIKHAWIPYPEAISGRFALLEKPFLEIAAIAGIDTNAILKSAGDIDRQNAINIATKWMENFENGQKNWVIISYSKQINGLLLWLRQIISESLGKGGFGIMPILAEGSMDEHSQLQLFLDGPDDKFYDIISSKYNCYSIESCHPREGGDPGNIKLDSRLRGNDNMPNLLAVAQTEHAFMVEEMLKNKGRDVNHKCYDDIDAHVVGDYIGTYAEVVRIIADKLGFDPYNQPAVEDIKQKSGPFPEMNRT